MIGSTVQLVEVCRLCLVAAADCPYWIDQLALGVWWVYVRKDHTIPGLTVIGMNKQARSIGERAGTIVSVGYRQSNACMRCAYKPEHLRREQRQDLHAREKGRHIQLQRGIL